MDWMRGRTLISAGIEESPLHWSLFWYSCSF